MNKFEDSNELTGSVRYREFLDQLRYDQGSGDPNLLQGVSQEKEITLIQRGLHVSTVWAQGLKQAEWNILTRNADLRVVPFANYNSNNSLAKTQISEFYRNNALNSSGTSQFSGDHRASKICPARQR